jgi:hypothetical protein
MKTIRILTNSENLVCTVLVMCCLKYLAWKWFWICFILNEMSAYCARKLSEKEDKV